MNQPYVNWSREKLCDFMIDKASRCGMGNPVKLLIAEAIDSNKWNPLIDHIGHGYLSKDAISSFVYSYLFKTSQLGKDAHDLTYYIMKMENPNKFNRIQRYFSLQLRWVLWSRWFYDSKEYTVGMVDALAYINR